MLVRSIDRSRRIILICVIRPFDRSFAASFLPDLCADSPETVAEPEEPAGGRRVRILRRKLAAARHRLREERHRCRQV